MPRGFKIDDCSPLIEYEPSDQWYTAGSEGDSQGDRHVPRTCIIIVRLTSFGRYDSGTKTWTNTSGAFARFRFFGTAVTVYGAKRENHGNYTVEVNGMHTYEGSGYQASPGEFKTALYNMSSMETDMHEIRIANNEDAFLDIDYVRFRVLHLQIFALTRNAKLSLD
jgi:hypothetical protein